MSSSVSPSPLPVIFLMGPTASGKTDVAARLYQSLPVEIISVDSAMVYRGLDIGTAKPPADFLRQTPHHLIDIRDPAEPYSAADFRRDALALIPAIHERGRVPLLVGGTLLYFKALRDGLAPLPEADPELRQQLLADAEQHGWEHLHQRLGQLDPEAAKRIRPADRQRLQRALEVCLLSGQPLSELHKIAAPPLPWPVLPIAWAPGDRNALHQRIARRFDQILADGLLDEVRALRQRGDLHAKLPAIKSVGYRQAWAHLDGDFPLSELRDRGIFATRQLAKRQYTWLRGWGDATDPASQPHWIDALAPEAFEQLAEKCQAITGLKP